MARSRELLIPYLPRRAFQDFHDREERWACIVAHRRAGKTVAAVNDLIIAATACDLPEPRFAYVAPFTSQAKDVAWSYLRQYTTPIEGSRASVSELRVDLPNGARIRLYGADHYLWLLGGDLRELLQMRPAIEAWARDQGCTRILGGGPRRGWERVLRPSGYRPEWIIYCKDLSP